MITKTRTTQNGISYWITTGDDEDDILYGSGRADYYLDVLNGGAGNDILHAGDGNDTVNGDDGNDKLYGEGGSDNVNGGNGNDILDGSGGNDTVNGGAGNDVVAGGDDDDLLTQQDWFGTDRFDGGRGTDTLDYSGAATDGAALPDASVHVSLATGTVIKYLDGVESATDTIRNVDLFIVSAFNDTLDGNSGANMLEGRLGNDVLNGGGGNDTLKGDFGANFLSLNDTVGGDDTLNGGVGDDSLFGGAGNDRFVQDSAFGGDKIDGGVGSDTVDYSQLDSAGIVANLATGKVFKYANGYQRGIDTLHNIETLIATDFNDTLTGGGANDLLVGGAGDDRFAMLVVAGNDTLDGGSGLDTLDYSAALGVDGRLAIDLASGTVTKYLGATLAGIDTILNIETVVVTGNNDTITGSDKADVLDGGAGNDVLNGGNGDDQLIGGAGNDVLSGGNGDDVLTGGAGNDIINGGFGANVVRGGDGDDTIVAATDENLDGGSGIDTLDYSYLADPNVSIFAKLILGYVSVNTTWDLQSIVDNFEILIGTRNDDKIWGTDHSDTLYGGAGDDTIDGAGGNDYLVGGDGNDHFDEYSIYGNQTMDGGSGIDTVDYTDLWYTHNVQSVEIDLAAGTVKQYYGNHSLGGTDFLRNIEIVIGSDGADLLTGGENDDDLRGGGGADTLNGAGGNDKLSGGEGDDRIIQEDWLGNDTIDGGEGNDTLVYRLSANLSSIEIDDRTMGRLNKYSADHVLLGVDSFVNIQHIYFVPVLAPATSVVSTDNVAQAAADAVADIVTVADAIVDAAEITMVGVPMQPVLAPIA